MTGLIDKVVEMVSPKWAYDRKAYRTALSWSDSDGDTRLDRSFPRQDAGDGHFSRQFDDNTAEARDRSRHAYDTSLVATGLVDTSVNNVVGDGHILTAATSSKTFNSELDRFMGDWYHEADIRGLSSWPELQALIFNHRQVDGDVGIVLTNTGELQVIEAVAISTPTQHSGNDSFVEGVECNGAGKPLRFWVSGKTGTDHRHYVPDDFLYMTRRRRATDTRGRPPLAISPRTFDLLDGYLEATMLGAELASMLGIVIESERVSRAPGAKDSKDRELFQMEPGMVTVLQPGEKIGQVTPAQPTAFFDSFTNQLVRFAGLSFGIPLELALLDFSKTNFSSARASLLQAYRVFRRDQRDLYNRVLRPVYRWRVQRLIDQGEIKTAAPADALAHEWIPPGWQYIDPEKEATAAIMSIDAGLETRAGVLARSGQTPEKVDAQRELERAGSIGRGIPIMHSVQTHQEDDGNE